MMIVTTPKGRRRGWRVRLFSEGVNIIFCVVVVVCLFVFRVGLAALSQRLTAAWTVLECFQRCRYNQRGRKLVLVPN